MDTYRITNIDGQNPGDFDAPDDAEAMRVFEEMRLYRRTFLGWVPIAAVIPRLTADARTEGGWA